MMSDTMIAIRRLLDEQEAAWAAGDAEAFARAVLPDIVFTNVVGMFSIGRAGFIAQHRHIFSSFYRGSIMKQAIEQVTFARPDVAIVNTLTEVGRFDALPPAFATQGGVLRSRLEQVLVDNGGGWQVAAFHNVIVHPDAASAAPSPGTA